MKNINLYRIEKNIRSIYYLKISDKNINGLLITFYGCKLFAKGENI